MIDSLLGSVLFWMLVASGCAFCMGFLEGRWACDDLARKARIANARSRVLHANVASDAKDYVL